MPDIEIQVGKDLAQGTRRFVSEKQPDDSLSQQAATAADTASAVDAEAQTDLSLITLDTLRVPAGNPVAAIASRRNLCYGFAAVVRLGDDAVAQGDFIVDTLTNVRDEILATHFDRQPGDHKVKSEKYIKQKNFHASFFGMTPCLQPEAFDVAFLQAALSSDNIAVMREVLEQHLSEDQPYLQFNQFELMPDGSVLARFSYYNNQDQYCLTALKAKLDPSNFFTPWNSASATAVATSVAPILCVVNADETQREAIRNLLKEKTVEFKAKLAEKLPIHAIEISHFDKRTMTPKHLTGVVVAIKKAISESDTDTQSLRGLRV